MHMHHSILHTNRSGVKRARREADLEVRAAVRRAIAIAPRRASVTVWGALFTSAKLSPIHSG
eukprot:2300925-Pleurochrysis_carterae.AAC.2